MNDFNDIQNIWQNQARQPKVSAEELNEKAKMQKLTALKKYLYTIIILTIVSAGIMVLWWLTPLGNAVSAGLSIMFSALIVRIGFELYSYNKMKAIDISAETELYHQKLKAYYRQRRIFVTVVTFVSVLLYIVGFLIMLPVFKATLPQWFYIYILVFLIIGIPVSAYLLIRHARRELSELRRVLSLLD
ncbi:hypothetical protein [Carboxylicivirga sp. RSCT41]|uniref:hypothetical protein n=1 Tax=Carboxylicivirga agarovorans TaxID=3417570 RepID=UPI003D339821